MVPTADRKERLTSLAGVLLLHLLLGWALLLSLAPALVHGVSESLDVFDVPQPLSPPRPERASRLERDSAPAEPAGKSAPPRPLAQPVPPMAVREVAPPAAAELAPARAGETHPIAGTATGSGAAGQGGGASGSGTGADGRGAGGAVTRAELRAGRIVPSDYPRGADGHQGIVVTRLTVSATGAVTGCSITRSSGNAVLDATTCRLIRERFRYAPARDAQGIAVPDVKGWQQRWWRD